MFPKAMQLQPKYCLALINHHGVSGGNFPNVSLPKCMDSLEKHHCSAEDANGVFQGFEKYLNRLLKLLGDLQRQEENDSA